LGRWRCPAFETREDKHWNPSSDAGRAALDAMITRQAEIIAYIDDFKLLMMATLAVIPLLIVFKKASDGGTDHTVVVE
jgi:DHA2 family multidrug resistance protein